MKEDHEGHAGKEGDEGHDGDRGHEGEKGHEDHAGKEGDEDRDGDRGREGEGGHQDQEGGHRDRAALLRNAGAEEHTLATLSQQMTQMMAMMVVRKQEQEMYVCM